jgi:hypothetical protein
MFDNDEGIVILCGFGSALVAEIEIEIGKKLDVK